ncbi:MAG TPA: hypothetical protein VIB99_01185 [Candidatus Limnocylindrales bacterium]|jgi:hypothetical protein
MADPTADTTTPIAWRALPYGASVGATGGEVVGIVTEVLGSDSEDVFHGLRVRLSGETRDVMLGSEYVSSLTAGLVQTSLPAAAFEGLPAYADENTYHLASVGWLRKHAGWVKDSDKDEEPG